MVKKEKSPSFSSTFSVNKRRERTLTAERELSPQLSQMTPSKSKAYKSPIALFFSVPTNFSFYRRYLSMTAIISRQPNSQVPSMVVGLARDENKARVIARNCVKGKKKKNCTLHQLYFSHLNYFKT